MVDPHSLPPCSAGSRPGPGNVCLIDCEIAASDHVNKQKLCRDYSLDESSYVGNIMCGTTLTPKDYQPNMIWCCDREVGSQPTELYQQSCPMGRKLSHPGKGGRLL